MKAHICPTTFFQVTNNFTSLKAESMPKNNVNSEYLRTAYQKNNRNDFTMDFVKYNAPFLRLYKCFHSQRLAVFLLKMECIQYYDSRRKSLTGSDYSYQDVLENLFTTIEDILINDLCLINASIINEYAEVSGFNVFNAESIPFFGDNYIAVNSGIFYYAHVFARSLQPIFIENSDNDMYNMNYMRRLLYNWVNRWPRANFQKAAFCYLTGDRRNAHMNCYLIPEDDSLLNGIELFVTGHEYAHLLSKEKKLLPQFFDTFFSHNIVTLINSDEEIKADAFAVILLSREQCRHSDEEWLLYSPLFLFDLLRYLDIIVEKKYHTKTPHPCNSDRYNYLKQMVDCLVPNNSYCQFHNKLEKFVLQDAKTIRLKVKKHNSKMAKLFDIFESYHNDSFYSLLKD